MAGRVKIRHQLREQNTDNKCYNGRVFMTDNYGEITIVGQSNHPRIRTKNNGNTYKSYDYFLVQFSDGSVTWAKRTHIITGQVKNRNHPSVFGVGYIGYGIHEVSTNGKVNKTYTLWHAMIQRGHDPKYKAQNPAYLPCSVHPRWHSYQNFCNDIVYLQGYQNWLRGSKLKGKNPYELDKDIKIPGNKLYSKDTCMFVTSFENTQQAQLTGLTYTAIHLISGEKYKFNNISEFLRKHGLKKANIQKALDNPTMVSAGYVCFTGDKNLSDAERHTLLNQRQQRIYFNKSNKILYTGTRIADGYTEEFYSMAEFARKYNLQPPNIHKCINKVNQTHLGWKFKVVK